MNKELEALQLMRAISETYDFIVSVNLTKNHYYYINYEGFVNKESEEGVFDDVINYHASLVSDKHRDTYYNTFSREALIKAYNEGKKSVYLEYQQADDKGELHWLATHTMFIDNPYSDDIMEITIMKNIDERVQKEKENQIILKDALMSAEKANNAKSNFLSCMSHDIRTPMNAIIGMTTIAANMIDDKEKVKECLHKIGTASKFLLGLVNDILDISKIESGRMNINMKTFSMKELIESIIIAATTLTTDKKQIFTYNIDAGIYQFYKGDCLRVEQIFLNLISNANKFTQENGEIHFSVKVVNRSLDRDILQFKVEDNEFNQDVAKTILEMHNLKVDLASNGHEAVEIFTKSSPGYYTMIFMDIQMPEMDGYETTRVIRKSNHQQATSIPIYAMTANAFDSDISEAMQNGMNGHIAKPVDFDVVAQILLKYTDK